MPAKAHGQKPNFNTFGKFFIFWLTNKYRIRIQLKFAVRADNHYKMNQGKYLMYLWLKNKMLS
jgi:hypothetical protein